MDIKIGKCPGSGVGEGAVVRLSGALDCDSAPRLQIRDGGTYGIPYRALCAAGIDNLLVAGMMITSDRDAHMSTRNTVSCMGQGQAAGTAAALWGITAGVYLALMGPQGMAEIGEGIMLRSRYAMMEMNKLEGIEAPAFERPHFKEFVVSFDETGKTVGEINKELLTRRVFGGKDLKREFPELGNSALYCVTEVHTKEDIDKLHDSILEVVG